MTADITALAKATLDDDAFVRKYRMDISETHHHDFSRFDEWLDAGNRIQDAAPVHARAWLAVMGALEEVGDCARDLLRLQEEGGEGPREIGHTEGAMEAVRDIRAAIERRLAKEES